jgi:hypothetical protein
VLGEVRVEVEQVGVSVEATFAEALARQIYSRTSGP